MEKSDNKLSAKLTMKVLHCISYMFLVIVKSFLMCTTSKVKLVKAEKKQTNIILVRFHADFIPFH